jgi:hypothetical protein
MLLLEYLVEECMFRSKLWGTRRVMNLKSHPLKAHMGTFFTRPAR